jgi:GNAT-like C-terminal domain/N-acyltransferase N-terminal domain
MELEEVMSTLGVSECAEVFAPDWDRRMHGMPAGPLPFLTPEYVAWACREAYLPGAITDAVSSAARRVAADETLRALAWYCHASLFGTEAGRPNVRDWPLLTAALDRDAGLFYVLVLLAGTPRMQALHRQRGIPVDVVRATVLDLKLQLEREDYFQEYGHWGISPRILGWLLHHWRGDLYRLGRLQFVPGRFHGRLRAFRHRRRGAPEGPVPVVALSEEGVRYRGDGQVDGAGGVSDAEGGWTATLSGTDRGIEGFPLAPWGRALREPTHLAADEWLSALAPGDGVLEIHIAAGSPMDFEACGDSLRRALEFFPRHFPDRPFVGFVCGSWILDAQFQQLLPASSNLVRFQREVYLFPGRSGSGTTIRTVFGRGLTLEDLPRFPRETTMQRAFAGHLAAGGHFRGGGCFLLKEDLAWGRQVYRRGWPL